MKVFILIVFLVILQCWYNHDRLPSNVDHGSKKEEKVVKDQHEEESEEDLFNFIMMDDATNGSM